MEKRANKYQKDNELDRVLEKLNELILENRPAFLKRYSKPFYPVVFIVGIQRSGTTLLAQTLINRFNFSYPNNLIARFWNSPFVGASLYKSLNFSKQEARLSYSSDLGYTQEINGPNEFGYYWKRWLSDKAILDKEESREIFLKELAAFESVFQKPLLFKNLIYCCKNIEQISKTISNALFIHIERESIFNIQSTYEARLRLFNDENQWFGIKPNEYEKIKDRSPLEQIVLQVCTSKKEIRKQLSKIPLKNQITITYEEFVKSPNNTLNKLNTFLSPFGVNQKIFKEDLYFKSGNEYRIGQDKIKLIEQYIAQYENMKI